VKVILVAFATENRFPPLLQFSRRIPCVCCVVERLYFLFCFSLFTGSWSVEMDSAHSVFGDVTAFVDNLDTLRGGESNISCLGRPTHSRCPSRAECRGIAKENFGPNHRRTPSTSQRHLAPPPRDEDLFEHTGIMVTALTALSYAVLLIFGYFRDLLRAVGLEKNKMAEELEKQKVTD